LARAKQEAEALREQVQTLNDRLEGAREELAYAKVQLVEVETDLKQNEEVLARTEKDLSQASERLDKRVRGIYVDGSGSVWEALFSASSFSEFVNRLEFLSRLGEQDGEVFAQVARFQAEVSQKKEQLNGQRAKQQELVQKTKLAEQDIASGLEARANALRGKEQQVAQLEKEEEARQARLLAEAKEAARRAREAAQAQAQAQTRAAADTSARGGTKSTKPAEITRNVPPSPKGNSAVEIAMSMIGVPYRWGGSSPSGFDCSGLTMYAYAQVGISLPHSSRAQFSYGQAVSRDNLQPGDLVFFGSPIHHVGMYVGGGNMVHAPYSGANVRVSSMGRRDYVGARRIQ
jgi:cell wall-associated NlpC family hydrolase